VTYSVSNSGSSDAAFKAAAITGTLTVTVTGSQTVADMPGSFTVKYQRCNAEDVAFEVSKATVNWISLGFSTTSSMSSTDAFTCSPGASSNQVQRWWITDYSMPSTVSGPVADGATCATVSSTTTMTFTRKMAAASSDEVALANGAEVKLIWADGPDANIQDGGIHVAKGAKAATLTLPTPAGTSDDVLVQTLTFSGVTAAQLNTAAKKTALAGTIATQLDVSASAVTVTGVQDVTLRRRRRMLLATGVKITYEVEYADDSAKSALETKMAAVGNSSSAAQTAIVAQVAAQSGVAASGIALASASASTVGTRGASVPPTVSSPSPAAGDDDDDDAGASAIEKALRVDGFEKFVTLDPDKKVGLSWTLTDDELACALKMKGMGGGYVSLAFSHPDTPNKMINADAVGGDKDAVSAYVLAASNLGAEKSSFLTKTSSEVVGGDLVVKFTRSVSKGRRRRSLADVDVSSADADTLLLWAYHSSKSFSSGASHTKRGASTLNFLTGGSSLLAEAGLTMAQQVTSAYFQLAPIVLSLVAGLVVTQGGGKVRQSCKCCLQRRVGLPRAKPIPCLSSVDGLSSMRFGEFAVWLLYFGGVGGFMAYRLRIDASGKEWQRTLGWICTYQGFITAFPSLQSGFLVAIFGIPFERSIKHHRMMGRLFVIFMYAHFVAVLTTRDISNLVASFEVPAQGQDVATGHGFLALCCATLIWFLSMSTVRRRAYVVFYWFHVVLTKLTYLFALLHLQGTLAGMILMGMALFAWVVEYCARICGPSAKGTLAVYKISTDEWTSHIQFAELPTKHKDAFSQPGDYCFLTFPQISGLHRHPFSLASGPGAAPEFRIRKMGGFTSKLHAYLRQNPSPGELKVKVDGPYGKLGVDLRDYVSVVLVAGGIGVTPMISTLLWLIEEKRANRLPALKSVNFIFSVRKRAQLAWADQALTEAYKEPGLVTVQLYVTRPSTDIEMTEQTFENSALGAHSRAVAPANTAKLSGFRGGSGTNYDFKKGRPKHDVLLSEIAAKSFEIQGAVLACGPAPLVDVVERSATKLQMDFHRETFLL
jgi:predicted ferric reductase